MMFLNRKPRATFPKPYDMVHISPKIELALPISYG